MRFLIIIVWIISQVQYLHSMEIIGEKEHKPHILGDTSILPSTSDSLEEARDIARHWLDIIEVQREVAQENLADPEYLLKVNKLLDMQKTEVTHFLSNVRFDSLTKLLGDLLIYRIRSIELRKLTIDNAQQSGSFYGYVELAPRSEERMNLHQEKFDDYNEITYTANSVKSVCLHLLIQSVFKAIGDPRKLHPRIKQKIRVQPSLFNYLQTGDHMPWALDFTLGEPVQGFVPYHAIPDYDLIMDYFEESIPKTLPMFSGMTNSGSTIVKMTRFDSGMSVKHELPSYPVFFECAPVIAIIEIPEPKLETAPEIVALSQTLKEDVIAFEHPCLNSLEEPFVPVLSINKSYVAEKIVPLEIKKSANLKTNDNRTQQNYSFSSSAVMASPNIEKSIFSKAKKWLQSELFNYEIKTIDGRDWEKALDQISGVTIRDNSGSSHFEVLLNDRVVGGYFRAKQYPISYKKWLQKIIIDLGYNPSYSLLQMIKTSMGIKWK